MKALRVLVIEADSTVVDQVTAEIDLALWHLLTFGLPDLIELAYLIRKIQEMQDEPVLMGSDSHETFFLVKDRLR